MEYMTALPSRRVEIVDDQKNPQANKPKITWCAKARKAIIEFIAGGCVDESILDDEIERLQGAIEVLDDKDPKKFESKKKKIEVEIDAINSFKGLERKFNLKDVRFSKPGKKPRYLDYSGVHVSVRPEILVATKKYEHIGCLKLYLTKNDRLSNEDADFLCAILNHYADRYLSPCGSADPRACIVIDVFGERIFTASTEVKRHEAQIRNACNQIRETWSKIKRKPVDNGNDDGQSEMNLFE